MQHAFDVGRRREPGHRARLAPVALLVGLAIAGCGTSAATGTATARTHMPHPAKVSAAVRAQEQALHAQVLASLHAPASNSPTPGIPRAIPNSTNTVNRIVTATPAHPQLAIEGASVQLDLPSGTALATMQGPLYDNRYVGTNDPTIPARFVLTLTDVHGTLPLAPADVTIVDQQGNDILPSIVVKGGGPLPKQIHTGDRLTLVMGTIIAVGDGSIVYNPTGFVKAGHRPLVGWDFVVEDD